MHPKTSRPLGNLGDVRDGLENTLDRILGSYQETVLGYKTLHHITVIILDRQGVHLLQFRRGRSSHIITVIIITTNITNIITIILVWSHQHHPLLIPHIEVRTPELLPALSTFCNVDFICFICTTQRHQPLS